ncbi:hypothetical protein NDU88_005023 [Pleurodeles waltl]|uniref:Uncharacterized protein n=1 Tax=Pleurodeles waltl TaxID=8319 RepID=A0AAV7RHV0_PLEWA|nr:hypothetical protein NDU88_005023 [Pleurodeles waltl]
MAGKWLRPEELLEALMLRMDAMDQAIASLKAQTSSSGVVASSNGDVPQRVGIPSSEATPTAPKRARGRGRARVLGEVVGGPPGAGWGRVNIASLRPGVSASLVVDAGHAEREGQSRTAENTSGVVVPPQDAVAGKDTGETQSAGSCRPLHVCIAVAV